MHSVLNCAFPLNAKFRNRKGGMRSRGLWGLMNSNRDGQGQRASQTPPRLLLDPCPTYKPQTCVHAHTHTHTQAPPLPNCPVPHFFLEEIGPWQCRWYSINARFMLYIHTHTVTQQHRPGGSSTLWSTRCLCVRMWRVHIREVCITFPKKHWWTLLHWHVKEGCPLILYQFVALDKKNKKSQEPPHQSFYGALAQLKVTLLLFKSLNYTQALNFNSACNIYPSVTTGTNFGKCL